MKKVLSIVLSIAMVVCLAPTMAFAATTSAQANAAYSDISGTACEGAVNVLSALKVVDGFTDGTYKPEQTVTRAQMAKLIVTALGVADYATATTSKFVDMGSATWAIPYVEYASNLNIVNGVGNGKFNPNGTVTYEQAATMIVRALGYTDQCKEMNGTWPAIYIQKAMALNIFEDVVNGGANGANRGDVAIMLYNALDLAQVYADADGATHYKTGNNAARYNGDIVSGVSMMGTLNKNGTQEYEVISSQDADTALTDVRQYVGAAAKVTKDKNGDILAVGDIKTTFLTGDISDDGTKISVDDVDYEISGAKYANVKSSTGGALTKTEDGQTYTGAVVVKNGFTTTTNVTKLEDYTGSKDDVTIAAKVSGKTVKEIYSISTWTVNKGKKVSDSDLTNVVKNCKLLGKEFDKNDDLQPDTNSFVLNGVASLNDIKADNVVYVYTANDSANGKIRRVDVGTTTVTGEITKKTSSKITIDGKAYKFAGVDGSDVSIGTWNAGDEVTVYLDYNGKIFDGDLVEGATGNFAVVFSKGDEPTKNTDGFVKDGKIKLVLADGSVSVFTVDGDEYLKNVDKKKASAWTGLAQGSIVKYELDSANNITKIYAADATGITGNKNSAADLSGDKKITKSGYINTIKISDSAVIFTLPTLKDDSTKFDFSDSDDAKVVKLSTVLDKTPAIVKAIMDDNDKIVAMLISNEAGSDDLYGVVTSAYDLKDSKYGADLYIGSEKKADSEVSSEAEVSKKDDTKSATLSRFKLRADGKYSVESASDALKGTAASTTNKALVKFDNGYIVKDNADITKGDTTVTRLSLYKDAIVYIYDKSDDEWTVGSSSDITDDENYTINFYSTADSDDDAYGLVDYVVIYRA